MIESNITALFLAQDNNGLCHGHPQAQPGQVGGEGDGQDHGVPDFFCQSEQKIKASASNTGVLVSSVLLSSPYP